MKALRWVLLLTIALEARPAFTQQGIQDTIFKLATGADTVVHIRDRSKQTRLVPSLIVPGILIGYGISVTGDNGFYSSVQSRRDIRNLFGSRTSRIDDYLIYAPYAEFGALLLLKVQCKSDLVNTLLLIAKSQILNTAIVYPTKQLSGVERPDKSNLHSFPSGHTAQAFLAATIVYREYRYKSVWYGLGAYSVAASVALFRMINDKHWQSDVLVGAGVGMLSANIVFATHIYRWGRKDVCMLPLYNRGMKGMAIAMRF